MKLTKAQAKALAGETYYWSSVTGITWATPPDRDSFTIRNDVFEKLHKRKLVAYTEKHGAVHYYAITPAGRAALSTPEAPK